MASVPLEVAWGISLGRLSPARQQNGRASCVYLQVWIKEETDWKCQGFGYKLSHSQLKYLSYHPLLSAHPVVFFNLFLSTFPFCLLPAFLSTCPFFLLFHSFFQCSLFSLRNGFFCCYSCLASRKSCFCHWKLFWLWGHWIWPIEVSRRSARYVDILRWSCHDGCLQHCLIWQYLLSLQFWLKRKTVHLGSKAATCSPDLVLLRKALFLYNNG